MPRQGSQQGTLLLPYSSPTPLPMGGGRRGPPVPFAPQLTAGVTQAIVSRSNFVLLINNVNHHVKLIIASIAFCPHDPLVASCLPPSHLTPSPLIRPTNLRLRPVVRRSDSPPQSSPPRPTSPRLRETTARHPLTDPPLPSSFRRTGRRMSSSRNGYQNSGDYGSTARLFCPDTHCIRSGHGSSPGRTGVRPS